MGDPESHERKVSKIYPSNTVPSLFADTNKWVIMRAKCHSFGAEPGKLYRLSIGHGGLYCEACHNSTHAEYPSSMDADNLQPLKLQQTTQAIGKCGICHTDSLENINVHHSTDKKATGRR